MSSGRPTRGEPVGASSPWALSAELRILLRPRATYRALGGDLPAPGAIPLLRRPLLFLLVVGGFVSFTAAGRLVLAHVLSTFVFWSFGPVLQGTAAIIASRVAAPRRLRPSQAVDLLLAGNGAWYLLLVALSGLCLFAPDVFHTTVTFVRAGVLPGLVVAVMVWSTVVAWAFFRHALGAPWHRALLGVVVYYGVFCAAILGYLLAAHQLRPLLSGGT